MSDIVEQTSAPPDAQIRVRLQQALDLLNRGELVAAEAALDGVLAENPEEADALQLMGILRRAQNRTEEAEAFYRRSIAANPSLPQVHNNLGNLLRNLGREEDAANCFREAIRLKPNYADALLGLGLSLQSLKQFEAAEKTLRSALRIQPNWLMLKQSLAAVLNDLNRPKEAEALLRPALAQSTRDPRQTAALNFNLGMSLKLQRRYDEALQQFDKARELAPDMVLAEYNRGDALQYLGRLEEAVEAYQNTLARNPLNMLAHHDLNQLLYRLGRNEEFLRSFDDAATLYPEIGQLPLQKGKFLFQRGDFEAAREQFERAATLMQDNVTPHDALGLVFARMGDFGGAVREHEIAVGIEPENANCWTNFAETLIREGDPDKALSAAERAIAIAPDNQHALAMWGLALRSLDDEREEWLNDYERFVQVFEIDPPAGYADIESFNRDLNAYLDRLHLDRREFIDQTLRGGTQTLDNIFGVGHVPVEQLRAQIGKAVSAYIARMKASTDHPLLRRRHRDFRYSGSWSSRLRDCGFHTNHVHPQGWISSAYYIAVPEAVEDATEKQGWIKFGEPAFEPKFKDPIRRAVKPVPGTLVLFPSYMWHGTVPFRSPNARTTIAFDVVPK